MPQNEASPRGAAVRRPWRPYRVLAVSLYQAEAEIADSLTAILQHAGWPRANRSFVVREALLRLNDDLRAKTPEDVFRYFVERHASRRASGDATSEPPPAPVAMDRSGEP